MLAADEVRQREFGFEEFSRGWAIGSNGWKRALAKDFAQKALHPGMDAAELAELREANWQNLVQVETEVFRWLGEGKGNQEIGVILGISPRTAQKHTENILRKLQLENRYAAAAHAALTGK